MMISYNAPIWEDNKNYTETSCTKIPLTDGTCYGSNRTDSCVSSASFVDFKIGESRGVTFDLSRSFSRFSQMSVMDVTRLVLFMN